MSDVTLTEVRKGFYLDSVALMRLSREVMALDGVREAALMMGSPSNVEIMMTAGLIADDCGARGNDLIVALRADSQAQAEAALAMAKAALDKPRAAPGAAAERRPRSIATAVRERPEANLALISVSGEFAAAEARKALRRGLNVLMFSDNVPVEEELSLKTEARELGLLMMGPDCGTAIINGAPLGFANVVNRGCIGVIGASGTGTQEVTALVSEAGQGVSHAIGVGGRDLKQEIGGITTLMAMDALDADAATELVVLISKPPHPDVARKILDRIAQSSKPHVICFLGAEKMTLPENAQQAHTLREAADMALGGTSGGTAFDLAAEAARLTPGKGREIRGLFCGGTLCAEAQVILVDGGRSVVSNAAIPGVPGLQRGETGGADQIIDLGADEFTVGRAHPMIDPSLRDDMVRDALSDSAVAAVLVDLVVGYGAHSDPAGQLVDVVAQVGNDAAPIIASVTGTEADPQRRSRQIARLEAAGIVVAPSNAQACALALALAST